MCYPKNGLKYCRSRRKTSTKKYTICHQEDDSQSESTTVSLAWEKSRHLATLPLVSSPNDNWETSADIPYWSRVTTQIWAVLLIGCARGKFDSTNQKHYSDLGSDHPRRPRGSQSRKARRKFSSMGGRAPGYRLSPDHFQTVKGMLAPTWAQKMLCTIVSNRRTVFPEFFSWVRTRRLLSCHSCPVRSLSFPNQKRRNYRWVKKRFGCYQQEQFILHWENSVSDGSQSIVNNRKIKMLRRRESIKSNSLSAYHL